MHLFRFFEQLFRVDPSAILADYLGDLEDKQFEQFFIDHVVANVAKQLPQRQTDFASICLAVRQIKLPAPSLIQDNWKAALEKVKKTLDHDIDKTIIDAFIVIIEEPMIIADIVDYYSSKERVNDDGMGSKANSVILQKLTGDYLSSPTDPVADGNFYRIVLPAIMQLIRLDPQIIKMQKKEKEIGSGDRLNAVNRIIDTLELPNNIHPDLIDILEDYRHTIVLQITQLQISATGRVKLEPQQQLLNQQQQEQLGLKMVVIAAMTSTLQHKLTDQEIIHSVLEDDDNDDIYSGMSRMFS